MRYIGYKHCINLLELKCHDAQYEITKAYAEQLREKKALFARYTQTRRNIFLTLLTVFGDVKNEHYLATITQELSLDNLFEAA